MATMDGRVEDYLNDKLQAYADFDTLDYLLSDLKKQQDLLRDQLRDAEAELGIAAERAQKNSSSARHEAAAYASQQANIDQRLAQLTNSTTADNAVHSLQFSMQQLQALHISHGYTQILSDVTSALSSKDYSSSQAVAAANRLHDLTTSMKLYQSRAEGAAPHLGDHIERATTQFRDRVTEALARDLSIVLQKILWPKPGLSIPEALQIPFNESIEKLLILQTPEIEELEFSVAQQESPYKPAVLLPLELISEPLVMRFRYHFSGERPTNKLEKPEYFLSHALDLLSTYADFINTHVQPLLLRQFGGGNLAQSPSYIDSTSAFITALLPMIDEKALSVAAEARSQPSVLSHLIRELMLFDQILRDDWHYETVPCSLEPSFHVWRGVTYTVTAAHGNFDAWLNCERSFAFSRYDTIMADQSATTLDLEFGDTPVNKPTQAAIRVHDLLSTVTSLYQPLQSFSMKLRFLMDIQVTLLDRFHARLQSALEAYINMTSSFGRAMQGASSTDSNELNGVKGLDRICRIFGSADYFERALRSWSDDPFLLQLWTELQARARSGNAVGRNLILADVAKKTSSSLTDNDSEADIDGGALFDESAAAYRALRRQGEDVLHEALCSGVRENLRSYAKTASSWTTLEGSDEEVNGISTDLSAVVSDIVDKVSFLRKALSSPSLRKACRSLSEVIETFLLDRVIYRNQFSLRGARQISVDVAALVGAFERPSVASGVSLARFRKLNEALLILTLPIDRTPDDDKEPILSLVEAERRLFVDNEQARALLDELDIEHLSEQEARNVIRARIELRGDA